eukprot:TRINITY_DN11112_c0_g1_i3.p1 TRINITY_DN11112_c0_g1~~TRINITY_DN11112_c0_g1_i3.p1  ORF type:complete len:553 (+),score=109.11 TRINITY_DN11112_c0_g1_i3:64-1722(+)
MLGKKGSSIAFKLESGESHTYTALMTESTYQSSSLQPEDTTASLLQEQPSRSVRDGFLRHEDARDLPSRENTWGSGNFCVELVQQPDTSRTASESSNNIEWQRESSSLGADPIFGGGRVGGEGGRGRSTTRCRQSVRMTAAQEQGVTIEEYMHNIAVAKVIGGLSYMDFGKVFIEPNSVYGAAVLLPQLARSAGWPRAMIVHVFSSYICMALCVVLHTALLLYVMKEERVMDNFAGQMYLCDFGVGGMGPNGTPITAPRLYSWDQWSVRQFVATSLMELFSDKAKEIGKIVDPGEYGVESHMCRVTCCVVFIVSIMSELSNISNLVYLLFKTPSENESWFELNDDDAAGAAQNISESMENWLSQVRVKVAGMSVFWKLVTFLFVLLPKLLLWFMTAQAGINFLMETAGIDNLIVNSVALGFLLEMDDVMTSSLMPVQVQHLIDIVEPMPLFDPSTLETRTDEETMQRVEDLKNPPLLRFCWNLIPWKTLLTFFLTTIFVQFYYWSHCDYKHGRWVSKDVYMPNSMQFTILNAFFGSLFPLEDQTTPFWTMPD